MIKRHQASIKKFDGDTSDFVKFLTSIFKAIVDKGYSDAIMIDFTKYFLSDSAESIMQAYSFDNFNDFIKKLTEHYIQDKNLMEIELRTQFNSITMNKNEKPHDLLNRISDKIILLSFLNSKDFTPQEKIIKDKLLAAVPKTYYYRLQNLNTANLNDIISQLDKIQKFDIAQAEQDKYQYDPAVKSIQLDKSSENIKSNPENIQKPNIFNISTTNTGESQYQNNENKQFKPNYNSRSFNERNNFGNNTPNRNYQKRGSFLSFRQQNQNRFKGFDCKIHEKCTDWMTCPYKCECCGMSGNHYTISCPRKGEMISRFVNYYVTKYGEVAEKLAYELVNDTPPFIHDISEEEFEKRLKGLPREEKHSSYEKYKQNSRT